MPSAGALLCLASASAFGAMGIFGKLAYEEGANLGTLLAVRFVLAAAVLWLFVACSRGAGHLCALGAALGLAAALVYSAYILTSQGVAGRIGPLALSTLVCTGAAATLTLGGMVGGDIDMGGVSATGYGWLAGIALVSTVGAIGLFFAGLERVGPTAASILSTLEPVVTVMLAFLVFGESLGPTQLAGGTLVLLAVLAVRTPVRVAGPPSTCGTDCPGVRAGA